MNPFQRYVQYILRHWRKAARRAALYDTHLEVSRWLSVKLGPDPRPWLLYERPWTQAWSDDPLLEAQKVSYWPNHDTVVYVSGRSPFQGTTHGLAFEGYGIAIVDSLNPGTICHELGHLMGRKHDAIGSGTIMDPSMWPYRAWPNIPWEA